MSPHTFIRTIFNLSYTFSTYHPYGFLQEFFLFRRLIGRFDLSIFTHLSDCPPKFEIYPFDLYLFYPLSDPSSLHSSPFLHLCVPPVSPPQLLSSAFLKRFPFFHLIAPFRFPLALFKSVSSKYFFFQISLEIKLLKLYLIYIYM